MHPDVPGQRRRPPRAGGRRRARRDRGGAARPRARPRGRAQRLHAARGTRRVRPLGGRRVAAAAVELDADDDRRARGGGGQARAAAERGRRASRPTSAAASASRSCTRGRRRCSCRGRRGGSAREVKWTEDRREHFVSSAHERAQLQHVRVGFDDDGRLLGLDVRFWHDNGAYLPYGVIVPIITSTQLLGPYKPGAYRVEFDSLYTTTVIVTPYRGAGRPQGVFAMERTMDAIADHLGLDRVAVREAQLHPAARDAVRPADDVPGRASAGLRLGRLPGVDGQAQGARRLGRLRGVPRCCPGRGTARRHRDRLLRRGHRRRAVRGRPRAGRDDRQGRRRHRPDDAGAGARDGVRADRRRRARRAVRGRHRHDRRHAPDAVLRRHVRLAGGGDERQRRGAGGAGGARPRRCGSPPTRSRRTPTTSRSSTGRCG